MDTIAAIDVGSNAMRIAVGRPREQGVVERMETLRLPVRLGQDAFTTGIFSDATVGAAVAAFRRFREVTELFDVKQTRVVATSALREAANSLELIERIAHEAGFSIEVISSEEEARLIHLAVSHALELGGKHSMLIDIGGGSVEVTHSDGERILTTHCYKAGTVRLLKELESVNGEKLSRKGIVRAFVGFARERIDHESGGPRVDTCVGTGGNIEEMGKMRKRLFNRQRDDVISQDELRHLVGRLAGMTVDERIEKLELRPDRADVILPATIVLQMLLSAVGAKEVLIPRVGLKDGVVIDLAERALSRSLPGERQILPS